MECRLFVVFCPGIGLLLTRSPCFQKRRELRRMHTDLSTESDDGKPGGPREFIDPLGGHVQHRSHFPHVLFDLPHRCVYGRTEHQATRNGPVTSHQRGHLDQTMV